MGFPLMKFLLGGGAILVGGIASYLYVPVADPGPSVTETQALPRSQRYFRIKQVEAVKAILVEAADAALLAYADKLSSQETARGWRMVSIDRPRKLFGSTKSVYVIRVDDAQHIIDVAVRGTANFDDALSDLETAAMLQPALGFPAHRGFGEIADGILASLANDPMFSAHQDYKIRLSGHSLGGAVAALVAMNLHEKGREIDALVTFGSPRFVTNEGARKYQVLNEKTYRVVRCDDVIPFLPPPNFFGWSGKGYEATGSIFLMLKAPNFDYSRGIDIERDFVYQLRTELKSVVGKAKLAAGHRMAKYKELLEQFTPSGLMDQAKDADPSDPTKGKIPAQLSPVYYQTSRQSELCPDNL